MYWHGDGMGGFGLIWMLLNMLLFWGVLLGGGYLAWRALRGRVDLSGVSGGGPERLLAERYARGEIDDEEYRRRLGVLRDG